MLARLGKLASWLATCILDHVEIKCGCTRTGWSAWFKIRWK